MDHAAMLAMTGLLLVAAATDLRSRRIPNALTGAIALAGLLRIAVDLVGGGGLAAAAIDAGLALLLFVAGALLFHFGRFGGGDVKLIAAAALWLGAAAVPGFLLAMALAGGVLAAGYLVVPRLLPAEGQGGRPQVDLPYGVAIAAGAVVAML